MTTPNQQFIALWEKAIRDGKGYRYIAENLEKPIETIYKMASEYRAKGYISGSLKTYRIETESEAKTRKKFIRIWAFAVKNGRQIEYVAEKMDRSVAAAKQYRKKLVKKGYKLDKLASTRATREHRADYDKFINTWMDCYINDRSYKDLQQELGITPNTMKCMKYRIQSTTQYRLPKLTRTLDRSKNNNQAN